MIEEVIKKYYEEAAYIEKLVARKREINQVIDFLLQPINDEIEMHDIEMGNLRCLINTHYSEAFTKSALKEYDHGIKIREITKIKYDELKALNWAKEHKMALLLDKKQFEKIVLLDPIKFDFVDISKEPQLVMPKEYKN